MVKLLVSYPGDTNLLAVLTKLNTLNNRSGPFNTTILLGDVLTAVEQVNHIKNVKHDIIFTAGSKLCVPEEVLSSFKACESSQNIKYLGKYGVFTTADGVTIGYLPGDESFLKNEIESIKEAFKEKVVDILISFQWPETISEEKHLFVGSSSIDTMIRCIRPSYHFAVGSNAGVFFERAPFEWQDGKITRFISLGKFNKGEKWIYAFNLEKSKDDLSRPLNLTENPFLTKEVIKTQESTPSNLNSIGEKRNHEQDDLQEPKTSKRRLELRKVKPENCFFCLSNPKAQTHLVISIAEHLYLTIARGPLTRPNSTMNFSGHCLIIPIAHTPRIKLTDDGLDIRVSETPLYKELIKFETCLVGLFASFGLSTVIFYFDKSDSIHYHAQVFPISTGALNSFENTLRESSEINNERYSRNTKLNFQKYDSIQDEQYLQIVNSGKDYASFVVYRESLKDQTVYASTFDQSDSHLDVLFGRRVLAFIMRAPKRVKWEKCIQTEKKETQESESFKEAFKPFDFTINS